MQQTLKRVLEVERTVAAVAYTSSESVAADQQPEPGEEEEAVEPEVVHRCTPRRCMGARRRWCGGR